MKTYEDVVRELTETMKENTVKPVYWKDDFNFLGFACKIDEAIINRITGTQTIQGIKYDASKNMMIMFMYAPDEKIEDGICFPLELNEVTKKILINLSKGAGDVDVYLSSNDSKVLKSIKIFRSENSRMLMQLELTKAKIIQ